jgi:hypothetical protein
MAELTGEYQPEGPLSLAARIVRLLIFVRLGLYLLPWAVMSGGLILVGLLALGPRKDIPELWICLPAGLALSAVLIGLPLWLWRRTPPGIHRFEYDGSRLAYTVDAGGLAQSRPVGDIATVCEWRSRRRGLLGYRIIFRDGGSVILSRQVKNADELSAALKRSVRDRER